MTATYLLGQSWLRRTHVILMFIGFSLSQSLIAQPGTSSIFDELPYLDEDFQCLDESTAERYVDDFNINVNSFGGLELCDARVDTKKLLNDIYLVEQGSFGHSEETNHFIRDAVPASGYYSWMRQMTRGVRRGHDIPWATAYNSGGYFTMQDGWAKLSTLGRVGTIIHEARHTAGYRHMICEFGPYASSFLRGCDRDLAQEGSHQVEMEYYSRVFLTGENFHPVYQSMARLMNVARSNFVFNDPALHPTEILVATNEDHLHKHDGVSTVQRQLDVDTSSFLLKRSSLGVTLFHPEGPLAVDLYDQDVMPVADAYSYYKMINARSIEDLVDLVELDVGDLRFLVALKEGGRIQTYVFSQGEWSRPVQVEGANALTLVSPEGEKGLFVRFDSGQYRKMNPGSLEWQAPSKVWPEEALQYVRFNQDTLVLLDSGELVDNLTGQSFEPFEGVDLEQVTSAPVYEEIL